MQHVGKRKCAYGVLVGTPEGERPLGRPSCSREDSIKKGLQETVAGFIWLRTRIVLVNAAMNLRFPKTGVF
jgi:hypothetical protein